jgi:hypothetical protein
LGIGSVCLCGIDATSRIHALTISPCRSPRKRENTFSSYYWLTFQIIFDIILNIGITQYTSRGEHIMKSIRIERETNGNIEVYEYDHDSKISFRVSAPAAGLASLLPRDVREEVHQLSWEVHHVTQPEPSSNHDGMVAAGVSNGLPDSTLSTNGEPTPIAD